MVLGLNEQMLTLLALLPIILLVLSLTVFKKPAVIVVPVMLLFTIILALVVWGLDSNLVFLSSVEGIVYGIWPIGMIIFGSICLSNLMVASGSVQEIQRIMGTISNDVRITVVLVAWGLESFLESIAGFGSGLALPISILMVMGVSPFRAGFVALLANSVPTAYGGVGIGIIALSGVTGVPLAEIMNYLSWQLLLPSIVMPFVIVRVVAGSWAKVKEIFWVPLFAGLGQGLALMLPLSASVVAVLSGALNIGGGILATILFYPDLRSNQKIEFNRVIYALSPFLIAIVLILGTGPLVPVVNNYLNTFSLDLAIYPEGKPLMIRWFTDAGVLLLISGIIGARIQGLSFTVIKKEILNTVLQLRKTVLVLVSILAMSKVMMYSGMIDSLAMGFKDTLGEIYPLFSPLLGTIGVLVTGSVTSSGILMGSLQGEMGKMLGVPSAWLIAMNASGATAGKMLAPHSVAIVMAALGSSEEESNITTAIMKVLMIYVGIMMIISYGFYIIYKI